MKNQNGFASIIGLLIVLSVLSYIVILWSQGGQDRRLVSEAKAFAEKLKTIKTQVDAYQADKVSITPTDIENQNIFPKKFSDLEPNYFKPCSTIENNKGICSKITQLPWGGDMSDLKLESFVIKAGQPSRPPFRGAVPPVVRYKNVVRFKLPDQNLFPKENNTYLSELLTIPNISYDEKINEITFSIHRIDAGLQANVLEKSIRKDMLTRDGKTTLQDSWNVGNQYIWNAKDVVVRSANGQQNSLSERVVSVETVESGTFIPKFSCPEGLHSDISVSVQSIQAKGARTGFGGYKSGPRVSKIGEFFVNYTSKSNGWGTKLEWRGYSERDKKWNYYSTGLITVYKLCRVN